ncbi:MAG: DUF362 domain-containing protein [Sedimentisphaerales bacterium]|nr:DUF362 domain-containing protein [Sedimentisphaerales bacterium]
MALAHLIGRTGRAETLHESAEEVLLAAESSRSVVWDIFGEFAVRGPKVHRASLELMVQAGLHRLTGRADPNQAWHCFLRDDDVIALTFTRVGSAALGTNQDLAAVLLDSLYAAGFRRDQIMVVGLDAPPKEADGTRDCPYGWQTRPVDFLTEADYPAAWLEEVTAIINVPSLMDDNIIQLRGALANLTLPLLKRPARLYLNRGDPFIPDVYSLPQIQHKVRLHIANGLRILYYGGPEVKQTYIYEHGSLLFGTDPVALDQVALQIIRRARRTLAMPGGVSEDLAAEYLQTAQALGLGVNDLNRIEYHFRHYNE